MHQIKQPANYPEFFAFGTKADYRKRSTSRPHILAKLTKGINRYNVWHSTGHGWQERFAGVTPIGKEVRILGFFTDGSIHVLIDQCGFRLAKSDVEVIGDWTIKPKDRQAFEALVSSESWVNEAGDWFHNSEKGNK